MQTLKTALVYFISETDLPISITESKSFQALLELCNPNIAHIMVRRTALTAHLSNIYFYHQEHIRKILTTNQYPLSLTTDTWTSPNVTAYMAVTGHFIDANFNLISVLFGLSEIEGDHSGASLANRFLNIIQRYNISNQIVCITSDNASVNNRMCHEIQAMCPSFSASTQSIGCMAHTIHLAARDGLNALSQGPTSLPESEVDDLRPMAISNLVDPPDGQKINYNSIISRISRLASYLNHSPQRRERFVTTVKLVYDENGPKNATSLLSNVCTRWNSTYDMLVRALSLKEAYDQFCSSPQTQSYRLNKIEWEKYPTINHALPLYILLIKRIDQACQQYDMAPIEPAAKSMCEKLTKYMKILITKTPAIVAAILDPRFKLKFFHTHDSILARFGTSATKLGNTFKEEAKRYFKESIQSNSLDLTNNKAVGLFDEMFTSSYLEVSTLDTELERFFAEPTEPKETDILLFWKTRSSVFPTLVLMAYKYLSIPATSAPSERVFSCGRKILTFQRASLSSMHVEQLSCIKNWARIFGHLYSQD
ncbi:hypothetical protein O181_049081 [Austropuccinia psidii MF-1]|uniref:HAT C-terminal dimerisation domain-containing protein n=1 Tax=Austropuccinia psidii MF-1 TaxID=1389203 RepID=A0A9Q3HL10_9BASI|nr:hypothetical protein [Austropuccinia psidii MF-1]